MDRPDEIEPDTSGSANYIDQPVQSGEMSGAASVRTLSELVYGN